MPPVAENLAAEFHQKYLGTVLRVSVGTDPEHVCLVESVETGVPNTSQQFKIMLYSYTINHRLGVYPRAALAFNFEFPKLGFVNIQNKVPVFVTRKSDKQFRRGPCASTLEFTKLSSKVLENVFASSSDFCFSTADFQQNIDQADLHLYNALYKREFPAFETALLDLKKDLKSPPAFKTIGRALSLKWAVSYSDNPEFEFTLWRELLPVGGIKFRDDGVIIVCVAELYLQEWNDYCQRRNVQNVRTKII